MKRTIISLATGLSFAMTALASFPGATEPKQVNVPQLTGGGFYGVTGFLLQPTTDNGDLNYAVLIDLNNSNQVETINPGYDWGIGFNMGYVFKSTGNDINFSYFHFNSKDDSTTTAAHPNSFITPISIIDVPATTASNQVRFNLNQFDLTAGQAINVGCRTVLHLAAGLRYANLDRNLTSNYIEAVPDQQESFQKSHFEGIGPLAGIDGSYYLIRGIGVVGHIDSALLIGSVNSSLNTTAISDAGTATVNVSNGYNTRIVPVIDAKLGLNYTYLFTNESNSDLTLEMGYQASQYFNALDHLTGVLTEFSAVGQNSVDFMLNGPYLSLTYHV